MLLLLLFKNLSSSSSSCKTTYGLINLLLFHPKRWMQKMASTYLTQQFCRRSRAAGCTATAATRRRQPSWWRRSPQAAAWCLETCRASCCSPQVSHPPSSQTQLNGKGQICMRVGLRGLSISHRKSHHGSLLSLLSRNPNHTVWWMKPKDHSCSRTKRFSFSVSTVKISVVLPRNLRKNTKKNQELFLF